MTQEEKRAKNREWQRSWRLRHPEHKKNNLAASRERARIGSGNTNIFEEPHISACEICGRVTKLVSDHDHDPRFWEDNSRSWLCGFCNLRLGWFEKHHAKIEEIATRVAKRHNFPKWVDK